MALRRRIAQLEHRAGMRGPCPVCGDRGAIVVVDLRGAPVLRRNASAGSIVVGEAEAAEARGCSMCGRQFRVVMEDIEGVERLLEERRVREA